MSRDARDPGSRRRLRGLHCYRRFRRCERRGSRDGDSAVDPGWRHSHPLDGFRAELQRDWARTNTAPALAQMLVEHAGVVGTTFMWEQQLLATAAEPKRATQQSAVGV